MGGLRRTSQRNNGVDVKENLKKALAPGRPQNDGLDTKDMQQLRKMCVLSLKRPVQEEDSDHLKKKKEISLAKVCHRRRVQKVDLRK